MHTGDHCSEYYQPETFATLRKFLDCFMLDKKNDLMDMPRCSLVVRKGASTARRFEEAFPPSDADLRTFYLGPDQLLSDHSNDKVSEDPLSLCRH
jgi:predicted acyl esterase